MSLKQIVTLVAVVASDTNIASAATTDSKATSDHMKDNKPGIFTVCASDGEQFVMRITDTCPATFDDNLTSVARSGEAQPTAKDPTPKDVTLIAKPAPSGHFIKIRKNAADGTTPEIGCNDSTLAPPDKMKPVVLNDADAHSRVNSNPLGSRWPGRSPSPASSIRSSLSSDVFGSTPTQVAEDTSKEGRATRALPSFIPVYRAKVPWVAPMFGFGRGIRARLTPS
jgi:hypothetical protein